MAGSRSRGNEAKNKNLCLHTRLFYHYPLYARSAMVVSIVVLVYNAERTIERCLMALLSQIHSHFELVLVDDGSTDSSLEKIYSFKDKRIKLIINDKNMGIAKSRNVGWKAARGEYIFFTDSDCMVLPLWLEVGVNAIKGKVESN